MNNNDERIVSTNEISDDNEIEYGLRPKTFKEYVGQVKAKENLKIFIEAAKQESIDAILEMAEYKKTGTLKALIVTGCLAQRYRDTFLCETV